jgi:hypothetical protein
MSSRKWDEELHNYEYTETFVAKRLLSLLKEGGGVYCIFADKSHDLLTIVINFPEICVHGGPGGVKFSETKDVD